MYNDEELKKLTVSELQDLAATNLPNLNQIVKHLNRKAINCSGDQTSSTEYEEKQRAIGLGSWFYTFMSEEPWNDYIKTLEEE